MCLNVIFPRKRGKIEKIIIGPLEKPIKDMRQYQLLTYSHWLLLPVFLLLLALLLLASLHYER
jgi:hypothetical protein